MRRAALLATLLGGLVAGCADDPSATPATDAGVDGPPADAADQTVVESRRVQIGPLTIGPGQEATVCQVVDLGNTAPRMVRTVRSELTGGTHHVIATLTTEAPTATPTPCGAFAGGGPGNGILTIAQQPTAALAYPDGAGLPITAHQSVHLEMHYLNAGDQPLAIGGTVTLDLADANAALAPVALTFTGNGAISIPAHTTAHLTSEHALPAGTRLFATTAHTHQWGRHATVELLRSAGDPSPLVLHDSTDWADRPLDQFAPITIGPDARLRLTCDFDNQSDQTVNFGLSAEDEMCFLWAHHVPQ